MNAESARLNHFINIDELKNLFNDFFDITAFPVGLVDVVTNELLLWVGGHDLCTEFHLAHPESAARCKESNKKISTGLKDAEETRIDQCSNGFVYACTPIIIQGQHLANLFTGQVLFSPPDLKQFALQAQKFGYDTQRYLEQLSRIPVVDEKRISATLRYLSKKIEFIVQKKWQQMRNEEDLSLALEAADIGLWNWDIQTNNVNFSDSYFTMLGYDPDFFPHTFETWKKLVHPEDLLKSVCILEYALSSSDPNWTMEFRMLSATGEYRWILGQGKVVEFALDGTPLRASGIHQDITQRKRDQQNLRDNEQKYRELFDNMSSCVALYSVVEGKNCFIIDDFNDAALKATGTTLKEILGKDVSQIFPGLMSIGLIDALRRVSKTGIAESLPLSQYQDTTLNLWVDNYVYKLPSGKIAVIFNDLTEKKLAEEAHAKKHLHLEQIITLATDAFFLGDPEGKIVTVNQQALTLSGYSRDELLGQSLSFLFSEQQLKEIPLDYSALKKGQVIMIERDLLHKNSGIIPIEMHSKMMPDGMFQSFFRDISERKKSQISMLKSQADLKEKSIQLEETNTALKILVKQSEQNKKDFEETVAANILSLVDPHLNKLKKTELNKKQANHVQIIESTLDNLVSPFVRTSMVMGLKLSPAEVQVANLIKQGKSTKQIAELLGLSPQTIDKHRSHIRKKIGITNKEISLRELLTSREFDS